MQYATEYSAERNHDTNLQILDDHAMLIQLPHASCLDVRDLFRTIGR
jgi:hypothetical protein